MTEDEEFIEALDTLSLAGLVEHDRPNERVRLTDKFRILLIKNLHQTNNLVDSVSLTILDGFEGSFKGSEKEQNYCLFTLLAVLEEDFKLKNTSILPFIEFE